MDRVAAKTKARSAAVRSKITAISRPEIYGDLENIDSTQVERAFQALTGATRETHWPAWFVFLEAVRSVLLPSGTRADWLNQATAHVTHLQRDGKINRAYVGLQLVANAVPNPKMVRRSLCLADKHFPALTDGQIAEAFAGWRPNRVHSTLASLCLSCGAFEFKRNRGESEPKARERVTKAIRQAVERAINRTLENGI